MGLDMYLYIGNTFSKYSPVDGNDKVKSVAKMLNAEDFIKEDGIQFANVKLQVAYWRKSNAVHQYFVDTCAEGKDECQEIYVGLENLEDLKNRCEKILENHDLASELLPTQSGFFFGSTEYDEYYFKDLKDTIKQITPVIERLKDKNCMWDVYYQASW